MDSATRRGLCVDLFSGVGMMGYGFEGAGFDITLGVDTDAVHAATHAYNFPTGSSKVADVSTLDGDDLHVGLTRQADIDALVMGRVPETPDLMIGGPPCPGFSTIGKRDTSDPRNRLVDEFIRLTGEAQPRYSTFENVMGMSSGPFAGFLDDVVTRFDRIGYSVVTPIQGLDARLFGVPQARHRIFVMAYRRGERAPFYPAHTHSLTGAGGLRCTPTVGDALADLPLADDFPELWETDTVDATGHWRQPQSRYSLLMRGLAQDPDDLSHPRTWNPRLLTSSRRTTHSPETTARYAALPPGQRDPKHRLTRLNQDGYSLTLRAGTPQGERGGHTAARPIHPTMPRVITVREGARLHSVPDCLALGPSTWHGFRMLGNSVPPLMARAVGHSIRAAAGLQPLQPTIPLPPGDVALLTAGSRAARTLMAA